jgi:hypothetical protein
MTIELKPCPFCGEELHFEGAGYEHPYSDTCPLDSLYIEDRHITVWNTRADAALRREREPVEPVAWLPTATVKWLSEYDGPACATTTAAHNRPIKSDGGVPVYATQPDALALVAAAYRDAADRCGAHSYSNNYFVSKALHDASTDILAKTPADAQAALAAIERAAYERGVRDAADAVPVDRYYESWMAPMLIVARNRILALLTQEGR